MDTNLPVVCPHSREGAIMARRVAASKVQWIGEDAHVATLENLRAGALITGIAPGGAAKVVHVEWFGEEIEAQVLQFVLVEAALIVPANVSVDATHR